MRKAYVYAVHIDGVLRYVGKGNGRRMLRHVTIADGINAKRVSGQKVKASLFYNRLAKALREGAAIRHEIVKKVLTDRQAFRLEVETIAAIRESKPGQLWNVHPGGTGMTSARARKMFNDAEFRKRHRAAVKAATNEPDERLRRSQRRKKFLATPEGKRHLHKMVKTSHTAAASKRRSEGMRRAYREDLSINRRRSRSARRSWSDPKLKRAQSIRSRRSWADPKLRRRQSEIVKKVWARRKRSTKEIRA